MASKVSSASSAEVSLKLKFLFCNIFICLLNLYLGKRAGRGGERQGEEEKEGQEEETEEAEWQ